MTADYEILVAGSGVAGLSAGLAAANRGRNTIILTGDNLGGNLLSIEKIDFLPNHPDGLPGYELCPMLEEEAAEAGAEFSTSEVLKIEADGGSWRISTNDGDFSARAVILATGTSLRHLGVPGEEEYFGKGVSHCASCDAPLLRDQNVAVVGGGDSALQEAITLASSAAKVTILSNADALSAQDYYRDQIAGLPNIEPRFNCVVEKIVGNNTVSGIRYRDAVGDTQIELAANGVFIYVGLQPNTGFLNGLLSLDDSGHILTDDNMSTEKAGLFAAGTIRAGSAGQAAEAMKEGEAAANAADHYLGR